MLKLDEQFLRDALKYQKMLDDADHALDPGGLEALRTYHTESKLVHQLSRPETQLIEEYRKLTSGAVTQRERLESVIGDGLHSLANAAKQIAVDSGRNPLRQAAEPAWSDFAHAARAYNTFSSIAKDHAAFEKAFASSMVSVPETASLEAAVMAAMKIDKPWIDSIDPARSFKAFGALFDIAEAIKGLAVNDLQSAAHFRSLLGTWTPPEDFALWDEAQRLSTYFEAGIDPRLFDIPAEAFEEAARAAGIVQPAPQIQPERTNEDEPAKPSVRRSVSIEYRVSISQDAQAQVNAVELMLREELAWRAATKHGSDWKKKFIHANVLAELKTRQAGTRVGKSDELLDFATFGELVQVIQRKDLWETCFADVSMTREEFRVSVERIIELRNAVGHVRRLDPVEFIWVFAEATRLQCAFGIPPFTATDGSAPE